MNIKMPLLRAELNIAEWHRDNTKSAFDIKFASYAFFLYSAPDFIQNFHLASPIHLDWPSQFSEKTDER